MPAERRQPLKIEVPNQKQESLRFARVGLIVTVGFAIGILWPRLAGFKLVPAVPSQPADSSSSDLTGAPGDPKPASAAPASAAQEAEPPPAEAEPAERIKVSEPQFVACKAKGKKRKADCDPIEFDRVARPHILALASCPGVEHMAGSLSLGFDLDFESQSVNAIKNGKSTTLPVNDMEALMTCEKKEMSSVSLVGIAHQNQAYSVFYHVDFAKADVGKSPSSAADLAPGDVTEATGHATVAWDVALVRASASRDGAVTARVLQGTRVSVTGRRGDWYRIKYDVKGNVGWVYRTAIGM